MTVDAVAYIYLDSKHVPSIVFKMATIYWTEGSLYLIKS